MAFFWVPLGVIILLSLKSGPGISFPFGSISFPFWYNGVSTIVGQGGFLNDPEIISATWNSLYTALIVTATTTVLAVVAALGLRKEFRGKNLTFYLLLTGMIFPGVIFGVGSGILYESNGIPLGIWTVVPVHVIWALPFGLILLLARFDPVLASYEEAARTLRASEWNVFRRITLPLISSQVVATALFAFVLSWGEVVRSKFIEGAGWSTLPVSIYTVLSSQPPNPKYYALGTVTVLISVTLLIIIGILTTRGRSKLF